MKDAPESVLHALFDAAMAVDGCMLAIFEHEHPHAGDAFRTWCVERKQLFETVGFVATARGGYHVVGVKVRECAVIAIHLDVEDKRRAA